MIENQKINLGSTGIVDKTCRAKLKITIRIIIVCMKSFIGICMPRNDFQEIRNEGWDSAL
jgi:hypothetical protein